MDHLTLYHYTTTTITSLKRGSLVCESLAWSHESDLTGKYRNFLSKKVDEHLARCTDEAYAQSTTARSFEQSSFVPFYRDLNDRLQMLAGPGECPSILQVMIPYDQLRTPIRGPSTIEDAACLLVPLSLDLADRLKELLGCTYPLRDPGTANSGIAAVPRHQASQGIKRER